MPSKILLFGNGRQSLFEVFWTFPIRKDDYNEISYATYSYDIESYNLELTLKYKGIIYSRMSYHIIPQVLQNYSFVTSLQMNPQFIDFEAKILP